MDNPKVNQAQETTLTPAEMFLNDLNATEAPAEVQPEAAPAAEEPAAELPAEETPAAEEVPAQNADLDQLKASVAELLNAVRPPAEAQEVPAQEPAVEEAASPEEPFDEDKFNESFYENPAALIRSLAESIAEKMVNERLSGLENELSPLLAQSKEAKQKQDVKNVLGEFLNNTSDAGDYFNDIAAYIKDNNLPTDDMRSYMDAYRESKLASQAGIIDQLRQEQAANGKTLDDYLADESSIAQIANNDAVKSKVIEDYLKTLQNGARPATITAGGSVQPVGTPANVSSSIDEAGQFLLRDLNR